MDLSLIIPCYNLEDYISKCIDSILSQDLTGVSCEVLFICDSCTDKTEAVICEKMKNCEYIQWSITQVSHRSAGLTRNVGIELATGKYIWFIDGDDWLINNNSIQELLNEFEIDPTVDILFFNFDAHYVYRNEAMVWRYMYKREAIGDTRFDNTIEGEDSIFNRLIKAKPVYIKRLNQAHYWYNSPRRGSIMETIRQQHRPK